MARTATRPWDAVDYLETEEDMVAYIDAALDDGDPALVAAALGDVARAKGMSSVAAGAGLGRESLYKALSRGGNPEFATVVKVMRAPGLRLRAASIRSCRSTGTPPSMSDAANRIVQKLWSYCHVLRDDGLSYQDYLEQLTFLLFLKMADERERLTGDPQPIPAGCRWEKLAAPAMEGAELERHYRETLRVLGTRGGMLGLIFEKAQNRIQDPAKLRRLIVELIGREDWSAMAADVKGDAYEGLLEKNAQDVRGAPGSTSRRGR